MSTTIRPEVSERNTFYISRHRYYELKHFCLQYPEWKASYHAVDGISSRSASLREKISEGSTSDPTAMYAEIKLYFSERMEMVEKAAMTAGGNFSDLLLKAVTEGWSYERMCPPCCKEVWYTAYRRFFWLLDKARK